MESISEIVSGINRDYHCGLITQEVISEVMEDRCSCNLPISQAGSKIKAFPIPISLFSKTQS